MRKMSGEGGATMHHRHIHVHDNAPKAHPRQEAYNDDNENNITIKTTMTTMTYDVAVVSHKT